MDDEQLGSSSSSRVSVGCPSCSLHHLFHQSLFMLLCLRAMQGLAERLKAFTLYEHSTTRQAPLNFSVMTKKGTTG